MLPNTPKEIPIQRKTSIHHTAKHKQNPTKSLEIPTPNIHYAITNSSQSRASLKLCGTRRSLAWQCGRSGRLSGGRWSRRAVSTFSRVANIVASMSGSSTRPPAPSPPLPPSPAIGGGGRSRRPPSTTSRVTSDDIRAFLSIFERSPRR